MGKTIFALLIRLHAASRVDDWNIFVEEDLPKGGGQKRKENENVNDNVYEIKQRPLNCLFTVTDVLDTVLALVCPCPPWSRARPLSQ